MLCNRCGMENERTDVVCVSCGARLQRPAKVPGAVCNGGRYVVRRHGAMPVLRYRAKRGFPVLAGVLPTRPVQTASAASPLNPAAARARPPEPRIERVAARQPAAAPQAKSAANREPRTNTVAPQAQPRAEPRLPPQPRPNAAPIRAPRPPAPPPLSRPAHRPPPAAVASTPVRRPTRPAQTHRSPGPRRGPPSQAPVIAFVTAGLLLGRGGTWWATVNGFDPAMLFAPAMQTAAAPAVKGAPPIPALASSTPLAAPKEAEPKMEQQAPPVGVEPAAAVEAPPPEAQEKPVAAPEKPRMAHRQAKKRVAPVVRQDRSEEIDRLRTQAFSETRQDRLDRINGARASKLPIGLPRPGRATLATRHAFNDCEHSGNILRREQCRWKVCGGRWGKNGCPSYESKQALLD